MGFLQCSKNWQHLEETEQNLPSDFSVGNIHHEGHSNLGFFSKLCVLRRSDGKSEISHFHDYFPTLRTPEEMLNEVEPTGSGTRNLIKAASSHAWVCVHMSLHLCANMCVCVYICIYMYTSACAGQYCVFRGILMAEGGSNYFYY